MQFAGCAGEPGSNRLLRRRSRKEKLIETVQIDDFIFNTTPHAELVSYEGDDTDVIIPDEAAGKLMLR